MLRIVFFLLILINLLVWTWGQGYLGSSENPDAVRVHQQFNPEKIRIVSKNGPPVQDKTSHKTEKVEGAQKPEASTQDKKLEPVEPPPISTKPTVEKTAAEKLAAEKPTPAPPILPKTEVDMNAEVCLLYKDLPVLKAGVFERVVAEKFGAFRINSIPTYSKGGFWVYIPPLANRRAAEKKVSELKSLGVTEYFIVQESGPNNLAISLGLFSTSEAAESYLANLRDKGVRSARFSERSNRPVAMSLELRGPGSGVEALKKALSGGSPPAVPTACESS